MEGKEIVSRKGEGRKMIIEGSPEKRNKDN